jgi:hypothetical protein
VLLRCAIVRVLTVAPAGCYRGAVHQGFRRGTVLAVTVAVVALSGCAAHPASSPPSPSANHAAPTGFHGSLSGTVNHTSPFTNVNHVATFTFGYALSVGAPRRAAHRDTLDRDVLLLPTRLQATLTNTTPDPRGALIEVPSIVVGGFYRATREVCRTSGVVSVRLTRPAGPYCFLPLYYVDIQGDLYPKDAKVDLTGAVAVTNADRAAGFPADEVVVHAGDSGYPKLAEDVSAGPDMWALGAFGNQFGAVACQLYIGAAAGGKYGFAAAQPGPVPVCDST